MTLDELREHCLKTLKHTQKFPTKTFEEHALVLQLIENQTSVIAEIEKIKAEIEDNYTTDVAEDIIWLIDEHISEIKGENNENS